MCMTTYMLVEYFFRLFSLIVIKSQKARYLAFSFLTFSYSINMKYLSIGEEAIVIAIENRNVYFSLAPFC